MSPRQPSASRTAMLTAMLLGGASSQAASLPVGLGWHELPNTRLRAYCPSESVYPDIGGGSHCAAVTGAWSGAVFDAAGNRLLIHGGGHSDWGGNEIYELDLDTVAMRRINEPSYPVRDGCAFGGTNPDGRPVARHTYNNIEYLPVQNLMFLYGGSRWSCGYFGDDTWTFNPATDTWTARSNVNAPRGEFSLSIVRDPVSGLLYARDTNNLYSFNPANFSWSKRSADNDLSVNSYKAGVIDPLRRRYFFYVAGTRSLNSYDISNPTVQLTMTTTAVPTCSFMDQDAAGWEYDPTLDRLVAWNGGKCAVPA